MKTNKIFFPALLLSLSFVFGLTSTTSAQEWYHDKSAGIYSIGFGGAQGIAVSNNAVYGSASEVSTLGVSINASGEYKVWKWIGVGWESGINIYPNRVPFYGTYPVVEIPFIAKANFHILDATPVSIKNKLDVYAGLQFGGGPAIYTKSEFGGGNTVYGIIHIGPQVGVRYWFNNNVAVFAEFGWGATFVNAGVTI